MSSPANHIPFSIRKHLFFVLLLLCSIAANAQVTDTIAPADTSYYDEEMVDSTTILPPESSDEMEPLPDTASLRSVAPQKVDSLKRLKEFEYANDPAYWIQEEQQDRPDAMEKFFGSSLIRPIMYVLMIGLVLFIIFKLIDNNSLFYRSKGKSLQLNTGEEALMEEENIESRLRQAINERDFRKAVRYQFVWMLQSLDQGGWIKFHAQSTNHDYQLQLRKAPFYSDFQFLVQVYEYVWYGEFAITEQQFNSIQPKFQEIIKTVRP